MGNSISSNDEEKPKKLNKDRRAKLTASLQKSIKLKSNTVNLSYLQLPNVIEIVTHILTTNNINQICWTDIKLDLNAITELSPSLFSYCNGLTHLSLRYNKLNSLPAEVCEACPNLKVLNVSNNPLMGGLPDAMSTLKALTELYCCNTVMKQVPSALGELSNLEVIDFFNCNIVELPKEMGKLANLRRLDLSNNHLESLPNEFVGMVSLQYLNINNNLIHNLPSGLGNSVANTLKELHMSRNGIDDGDVVDDDDHSFNLIDELDKMKVLIKLDLSRNKLTKVPGKFLNHNSMPSLKKLNLAFNPLVIINSVNVHDEVEKLKQRLDVLVLDFNSQNIHNKMFPNPVAEEQTQAVPMKVELRPLEKSRSLSASLRASDDAFAHKRVYSYEEFIERDQTRFENSVRIPFLSRLSYDQLRDRIKGCIFGAALGDAIGLATEFLSKIESQFHYSGEDLHYNTFIRDRHRCAFTPGDWTDDTDQMIVIMDCILNNNEDEEEILNRSNNPLITQQQFAAGLQQWAKTGFRDELGDTVGQGIGQTVLAVVTHQNFTDNPQQIAETAWKQSGCKVASNGALMRTAILGIPYFYNFERVAHYTKQICKTTHFDDRCVASCLALTSAISLLLRGDDLAPMKGGSLAPIDYIISQSLAIGKSVVKDSQELEEYMLTKNFRNLKLEEENSRGYTYKTLGAGFSSFYEQCREKKSFKEIITELVMEGGDADSNGCVSGALIGCRIGYSNLPKEWLNTLIHKEWLEQKVLKFLQMLGL